MRCIAVDDEPLALKVISDYVKKVPFLELIGTFDNPFDGLQLINHEAIDIAFLDINMPIMDGFEFLEAATEEFKDGFTEIVVAMLTTSLNPVDKERARKFDVVREYITKPLTKQHIQDVVAFLS